MLFWIFFYKLTPQLRKFNISTHDWISFPALGGTGVFISGTVNPIINSVKFLFWVSVQFCICKSRSICSFQVRSFINRKHFSLCKRNTRLTKAKFKLQLFLNIHYIYIYIVYIYCLYIWYIQPHIPPKITILSGFPLDVSFSSTADTVRM